jgi:hypothetical protein
MRNFEKNLSVVFHFSRVSDVCHVIRAVLSYQERRWSWTLTKKSFEIVHGWSRVVRLMPDKLATALVINQVTIS